MRRAGTITVLLGAWLFLGSMSFLPYAEEVFGVNAEPTLWDLQTREPVVLTVIAVVTALLAAASLRAKGMLPLALATCLSFYLFGRWFPVGARSYRDLGVGFWLATAATLTMSIGGTLAIAARP